MELSEDPVFKIFSDPTLDFEPLFEESVSEDFIRNKMIFLALYKPALSKSSGLCGFPTIKYNLGNLFKSANSSSFGKFFDISKIGLKSLADIPEFLKVQINGRISKDEVHTKI